MAVQNGWRWCIKCRGIFFGGHPTQGQCTAGGAHDGFNLIGFRLRFFTQPSPFYQDNWRWCRKCQGLFFHGNQSDGRCPSGSFHDATASGNYQILFFTGTVKITTGLDPLFGEFIWCSQCEGMWLFVSFVEIKRFPFPLTLNPNLASFSDMGACPRTGLPHVDQGSGRYKITSE